MNRAVSRKPDRFPEDFVFRLTREEWDALRCQFGISKGRGGRRYLPRAFTEQGVAMLSSVLRSPRAVRVNVEIMRAFVRMRRWVASYEELAAKLAEHDARFNLVDEQFNLVFEELLKLHAPAIPPERQIGFQAEEK